MKKTEKTQTTKLNFFLNYRKKLKISWKSGIIYLISS